MPKAEVVIDDLQGEVIDLGNCYVVEVAGDEAQGCCPYCESDTPYKHGVKQHHFVDIPHDGKSTLLRVERARWRCRSCRKSLFSPDLRPVD